MNIRITSIKNGFLVYDTDVIPRDKEEFFPTLQDVFLKLLSINSFSGIQFRFVDLKIDCKPRGEDWKPYNYTSIFKQTPIDDTPVDPDWTPLKMIGNKIFTLDDKLVHEFDAVEK